MGKKTRRTRGATSAAAPAAGALPSDPEVATFERQRQAEFEAQARRDKERMAPADAHMMRCNHEKIVRRAREALVGLPPGMARDQMEQIVDSDGKASLHGTEFEDGAVGLATVGLSLLGTPDIQLRWPGHFKEAAQGIVGDLVNAVYAGRADGKLRDGKRTVAYAYDLAYVVVAQHDPKDHFGRGEFAPVTARHLKEGDPGYYELVLFADLREGIVLPGGVYGTEPWYAEKDGESVKTDIVVLPVPSRNWCTTALNGSFAKLVDPEGPTDGPHVILTPAQFTHHVIDNDVHASRSLAVAVAPAGSHRGATPVRE